MGVNIADRGNVVIVEVCGVLDLECVDRLDSSGIATLAEAGSRAIGDSGRPCRRCRQEETRHMPDRVGLDGAFDTVDEALDG